MLSKTNIMVSGESDLCFNWCRNLADLICFWWQSPTHSEENRHHMPYALAKIGKPPKDVCSLMKVVFGDEKACFQRPFSRPASTKSWPDWCHYWLLLLASLNGLWAEVGYSQSLDRQTLSSNLKRQNSKHPFLSIFRNPQNMGKTHPRQYLVSTFSRMFISEAKRFGFPPLSVCIPGTCFAHPVYTVCREHFLFTRVVRLTQNLLLIESRKGAAEFKDLTPRKSGCGKKVLVQAKTIETYGVELQQSKEYVFSKPMRYRPR